LCNPYKFYRRGDILYWKISDFVEEIKLTLKEESLHVNTVYGWFKKLEKERIHYISRTVDTNEKIYDELDLRIAIFIKMKRNEKWAIKAIFDEVKNEFDVRPFPVENMETTNVVHNSEVINMGEGLGNREGLGNMFALVVVLFVLLIIIGCSCNTGNFGGY